jgi:hypothetical protein
MGDVKQVGLDLSKFSQNVPKLMSQLLRRAALEMMGDLVKGSPADTGRFKSSWFVGVGVPNRSVTPERPPGTTSMAQTHGKLTGGESSMAHVKELSPATVSGFEPIILSNNLPYGESLANGHSQQAPRGWITAAVQRVQRVINVVKLGP